MSNSNFLEQAISPLLYMLLLVIVLVDDSTLVFFTTQLIGNIYTNLPNLSRLNATSPLPATTRFSSPA